jgi:tetratricopeptide (TPR) repeat protein
MAAQSARLKRHGWLLPALLLTLSGCASFAPPAGAPAPRGSSPAPDAPSRTEPAAVPNRASTSLLEQSRSNRTAGRYPQAAAAVERALDIEPNNPELWLELGEIRLAQGDAAQAEAMARKALTLSAGDRALEARAARLIGR